MLAQILRADPFRTVRHTGLFELADLNVRPRAENQAHIRSLAATAYLGGGRALARALGRYKLFVDTNDVGHSTHLMLDGYWEMWLTEAIAAAVRPGMTCVDVGANLGYFSLLMADLVGPGGVVHAIEPNPLIATRLRDSLEVNGFGRRATVHEIALGDCEGEGVLLIVPDHEPKNAHVVPAPAGMTDGVIRTRRLDMVFGITAPDVIKIDADTSEEAIWDGMGGLLAGNRPMTIFLEFAAVRYCEPGRFLDRIGAAGFAVARLDPAIGIRSLERAAILDWPADEDQMLVLRR